MFKKASNFFGKKDDEQQTLPKSTENTNDINSNIVDEDKKTNVNDKLDTIIDNDNKKEPNKIITIENTPKQVKSSSRFNNFFSSKKDTSPIIEDKKLVDIPVSVILSNESVFKNNKIILDAIMSNTKFLKANDIYETNKNIDQLLEEFKLLDPSLDEIKSTGEISKQLFIDCVSNSHFIFNEEVMIELEKNEICGGSKIVNTSDKKKKTETYNINYLKFINSLRIECKFFIDSSSNDSSSHEDMIINIKSHLVKFTSFFSKLKISLIKLDVNNSGEIEFELFEDALEEIGIMLSSSHLVRVYEMYGITVEDKNNDNKSIKYIKYNDFLNAFNPTPQEIQVIITSIIKRMNQYIISQQIENSNLSTEQIAKDIFAEVDKSNDGFISNEEFKNCMHALNLGLDDMELDAIITTLDVDKNGKLSYEEFVNLIIEDKDKSNIDDINEKVEELVIPTNETLINDESNTNNKKKGRRLNRRSTEEEVIEKQDGNVNDEIIESNEFKLATIDIEAIEKLRAYIVSKTSQEEKDVTSENISNDINAIKPSKLSNGNVLRNIFDLKDDKKDEDIKISYREFKKSMKLLTIELNDKDLDQIMSMVDNKSNGFIKYTDLLLIINNNEEKNVISVEKNLQQIEKEVLPLVDYEVIKTVKEIEDEVKIINESVPIINKNEDVKQIIAIQDETNPIDDEIKSPAISLSPTSLPEKKESNFSNLEDNTHKEVENTVVETINDDGIDDDVINDVVLNDDNDDEEEGVALVYVEKEIDSSLMINITKVKNAMTTIKTLLMQSHGTVEKVYDKSNEVFSSIDTHGSINGCVDHDDFFTAIIALTKEMVVTEEMSNSLQNALEILFANFCDSSGSLFYSEWLAVMGFERSLNDLLELLTYTLKNLIDADNRSKEKIELFFASYIPPTLIQSDADSDGVIDMSLIPADYNDALSALGVKFRPREIARIFKYQIKEKKLLHSLILRTILEVDKQKENNNDKEIFNEDEKISEKITLGDRIVAIIENNSTPIDKMADINSNNKNIKTISEDNNFGLRSASNLLEIIHSSLKKNKIHRESLLLQVISSSKDLSQEEENLDKVIITRAYIDQVLRNTIGLRLTDGEIQRLFYYLNDFFSIENNYFDEQLYIESIGVLGLQELFDVPRAEKVVFNTLSLTLKSNNHVNIKEETKEIDEENFIKVDKSDSIKTDKSLFCMMSIKPGSWTHRTKSKKSSYDLNEIVSLDWKDVATLPIDVSVLDHSKISICIKVYEDGTSTNKDIRSKSTLIGEITIPFQSLFKKYVIESSKYYSKNNKIENCSAKFPLTFNDIEIGSIDISYSVFRIKQIDITTNNNELLMPPSEQDSLITLSSFTSDLVHALLFTRSNKKNHDSTDVSNVNSSTKYVRRLRRQRAELEGNRGGRKKMIHAEAILRLQAIFRGKCVRRIQKRNFVAATEIQRIVRGTFCKKNYIKSMDRIHNLQAQESERLERLRRIRVQERELALLRGLPPEDYLSFERLRRDCSAKIVQRAWRTRNLKFGDQNDHFRKKSHKIEDKVFNYTNKEIEDFNKLKSNILISMERAALAYEQKTPNGDKYYSKYVKKEADALSLAQLQRRIKDESLRKEKLRMKNRTQNFNTSIRFNPAATFSVVKSSSNNGFDFKEKENDNNGSNRNKYKDLAEVQQSASALLNEYMEAQPNRKNNHEERINSFSHCKHLLHQLSGNNLPTLEAAREMIKLEERNVVSKSSQSHSSIRKRNSNSTPDKRLTINTNLDDGEEKKSWSDDDDNKKSNPYHIDNNNMGAWLNGLPLEGFDYTINSHLRTVKAMGSGLVKNRWSLVAAPHDVTGPPIDIAQLEKINDVTLNSKRSKKLFPGMAMAWADGTDANDSLWWVSYAAQTRKKIDEEEAIKNKKLHENSESSRKAHEMLGDVVGYELLAKISKDCMGISHRRQNVQKKVDNDFKRVNRLAMVFEEEALALVKRKLLNIKMERLTSAEIIKRNDAATTIQSYFRGCKGRYKASKFKSEKRVMLAIQNLVMELTRKDLKSGIGSVPAMAFDTRLIQSLTNIQSIGGVNNNNNNNNNNQIKSNLKGIIDTSISQAKLKSSLKSNTPRNKTNFPETPNNVSVSMSWDSSNNKSKQKVAINKINKESNDDHFILSQRRDTTTDKNNSRSTQISTPFDSHLLLSNSSSNSPTQNTSQKGNGSSTSKQASFPKYSRDYNGNIPNGNQLRRSNDTIEKNQSDNDNIYFIHDDDNLGIASPTSLHFHSPNRVRNNFDDTGYISTPSQSAESFGSSLFTSPADGLVRSNNIIRSEYKDDSSSTPTRAPLHIVSSSHTTSQIIRTMELVSSRFENGCCEVTGWLESALAASPSNFQKSHAIDLIQELTLQCGMKILCSWLEKCSQSKESNNIDSIEVESAATLLGELAKELGLLDDNQSGPYKLIQLCLLLRLLGASYDGTKNNENEGQMVSLVDIFSLIEDASLRFCSDNGIYLSYLLSSIRHALLLASAKSSTKTGVIFDQAMSRLLLKQNKTLYLSISQVVEFVSSMGPRGTGILGTVKEEDIISFVRFISFDDSANGILISSLKSTCCSLNTFRKIQSKLNIFFRAVPEMYQSVLNHFDNDKIDENSFCNSIREEVPLSESEGFVLAMLLKGRGIKGNEDIDINHLLKIKQGSYFPVPLS